MLQRPRHAARRRVPGLNRRLVEPKPPRLDGGSCKRGRFSVRFLMPMAPHPTRDNKTRPARPGGRAAQAMSDTMPPCASRHVRSADAGDYETGPVRPGVAGPETSPDRASGGFATGAICAQNLVNSRLPLTGPPPRGRICVLYGPQRAVLFVYGSSDPPRRAEDVP